MSRSYKASGIILRRTDYADADRIYTILTPEKKVAAIAKGVRKSTAKLASQLELFTVIELMFIKSGRLDIITSARSVPLSDISTDYERLRRGFLFLEMADKMTDTEEVAGVYEVLEDGLMALATQPPLLCELGFKLRLLQELGHAPDMSVSDTSAEVFGFDVEQGVLVTGQPPSSLPMSQNAIKLWRLLLQGRLTSLTRIKGAEGAAAESIHICDRFIAQQFGIGFRSAEL